MQATENVIDELGYVVGSLIQRYAWYVVMLGAVAYWLSPHIALAVSRASIAHANRSARKEILDKERKRARMIQQLDVYKSNRLHRDGTGVEKDLETGCLREKFK